MFAITGGFVGFSAASTAIEKDDGTQGWSAILYNPAGSSYTGIVDVACVG